MNTVKKIETKRTKKRGDQQLCVYLGQTMANGCVWTTWGPCSDQPVDRNLWDTPLRCCLAKQTPLPSPPLTQSAETLTGGPARNLYWQAATTNQSTEGMPGSCMRTLRKMWFAVLPLFSNIEDWTFLGQCEHSRVGEAHERRIAARSLREEIYLFELPAIRHGGHHLCQLLLLALQHTVHMFDRNLRGTMDIWGNGMERER